MAGAGSGIAPAKHCVICAWAETASPWSITCTCARASLAAFYGASSIIEAGSGPPPARPTNISGAQTLVCSGDR